MASTTTSMTTNHHTPHPTPSFPPAQFMTSSQAGHSSVGVVYDPSAQAPSLVASHHDTPHRPHCRHELSHGPVLPSPCALHPMCPHVMHQMGVALHIQPLRAGGMEERDEPQRYCMRVERGWLVPAGGEGCGACRTMWHQLQQLPPWGAAA